MTSSLSIRDDDERLLTALAMRISGYSTAIIANSLGYRRAAAVRTATSRVRDCDIAESGEPESLVRAGYWQ